uniref:TRIM2_3 n=1 Tax=Macrostomum lignano TaxID=282301 RepID=A0A1I8GGC6_9PLAT
MIVSDFHNHCVKIFDSQGQFQFCIGCAGSEAGRLNAPTGVAVDLQDNIMVADWGSSSIQVFNSEGSFLASVNTAGDQLYGPQGLAYCAKANQLVVVDTGNHCFKVYKCPV